MWLVRNMHGGREREGQRKGFGLIYIFCSILLSDRAQLRNLLLGSKLEFSVRLAESEIMLGYWAVRLAESEILLGYWTIAD